MAPQLAFLLLYYDQHSEGASWEWVAGGALFAGGVALRWHAQRFLRYRLDGERELATDGPYAWVRNPVYLANSALLASLAFFCKLPWMAPVLAIWAMLVY